MNKITKQINEWMAKPIKRSDPRPAMFLAVLSLGFLSWTRLDSDSFYMIAQGKDILANGIPYENAFSYYEGAAIVVQQWPYCVMEYLASTLPYNIGLWLFMMVQAMALYLLFARVVAKHTEDLWISTVLSAIICIIPVMPYFYSCRPENLTLILLLLEGLALEKYRDTSKARWLAALPALMVLEINLHGSMWPFHFCILAAYAVPPLPKGRMRDNHVKMDARLAAAGLSMVPATLLNPYGIDMPLYIVRSMAVFDYVPIVEQNPTGVFSSYGLQVVLCAVILAGMLAKKKISSVSAYMSAGFLLLASMQYHGCMFLPFVMLYICRDALDWFESIGPARFDDMAPNALRVMWWSLAALAVAISLPYGISNLPDLRSSPKMDDAIRYVAEHQRPGEAVLNMLDTGSVMEHAGIRGVQSDTRPELMLSSINGTVDAHLEYYWFYNGVHPEEDRPEYESIGAYLDHYNIQFIVDRTDRPAFRYLAGWLADDPGWVLADLGETDEECVFGVWVRKEAE